MNSVKSLSAVSSLPRTSLSPIGSYSVSSHLEPPTCKFAWFSFVYCHKCDVCVNTVTVVLLYFRTYMMSQWTMLPLRIMSVHLEGTWMTQQRKVSLSVMFFVMLVLLTSHFCFQHILVIVFAIGFLLNWVISPNTSQGCYLAFFYRLLLSDHVNDGSRSH